jgi:hypothetical protein
MILPAITLYQPWATWIMRGWKTIETRTHNRFVSLKDKTILIHAGKTTEVSEAIVKNPYLTKEELIFNPQEIINGHIIGQVDVIDFRELGWKDSYEALIDCEFTQRYGLFLRKPVLFESPIKVDGSMGIWYFDMQTLQKVKKTSPQLNLELF